MRNRLQGRAPNRHDFGVLALGTPKSIHPGPQVSGRPDC